MLIGRLYRVKLPSHIPQKKQRVFHPRSMAAAGEGGGGGFLGNIEGLRQYLNQLFLPVDQFVLTDIKCDDNDSKPVQLAAILQ